MPVDGERGETRRHAEEIGGGVQAAGGAASQQRPHPPEGEPRQTAGRVVAGAEVGLGVGGGPVGGSPPPSQEGVALILSVDAERRDVTLRGSLGREQGEKVDGVDGAADDDRDVREASVGGLLEGEDGRPHLDGDRGAAQQRGEHDGRRASQRDVKQAVETPQEGGVQRPRHAAHGPRHHGRRARRAPNTRRQLDDGQQDGHQAGGQTDVQRRRAADRPAQPA